LKLCKLAKALEMFFETSLSEHFYTFMVHLPIKSFHKRVPPSSGVESEAENSFENRDFLDKRK
jgi:hypothetical protein